MAGEKDTVGKATDMVQVWASTADALLQDWLEKGKANDRLGTALASVRIAQLGLMLTNYFKEVGEEFLRGDTEVKAAQQAVAQLDTTVRRAMNAVGIGSRAAQVAAAETDPSMN